MAPFQVPSKLFSNLLFEIISSFIQMNLIIIITIIIIIIIMIIIIISKQVRVIEMNCP